MSYDISILVNGSRCKQYFHEGKTFIEAKDGSEYTIEIKNNTWQRILAVCSVDGLDILTGKKAIEGNPGYVISAYNVGKFDGFRVSNDTVAKFVFGAKGDSYAADKGDGSEKNVGVIGIRLFNEKIVPPPVVHHHHYKKYVAPPYYASHPTIWCDSTLSGTCNDEPLDFMGQVADTATYSCDNIPTKGAGGCSATPNGPTLSFPKTRGIVNTSAVYKSTVRSKFNLVDIEPLRGFDMGTQWGEAKESRVTEVEFTRSTIAVATEIYYASRQSLIQMGVPLGNEKQVSFPEAFADSKYAKPPKNWRG